MAYMSGETLDELNVHNMRTGETTMIARRAASPATDGRYVFWSQGLATPERTFNIYGYDVAMGSTFLAGTTDNFAAELHLNGGALSWLRLLFVRPYVAEVQAVRVEDVLPSARRPAPATTGPDLRYFAETGHNLSFAFKSFWERSGGLPVFGYPLTEEFTERNRDTGQSYAVQYLERQRYEYHPENRGTPYAVLLGRLGVEALQREGRDWQSLPKAAPGTPHYVAATGHAIAPQFWDYWRSHGLEFGDRGVTEREALALFGYPITEPEMETNSSGDRVLTQWFERARFEHHPNNPACLARAPGPPGGRHAGAARLVSGRAPMTVRVCIGDENARLAAVVGHWSFVVGRLSTEGRSAKNAPTRCTNPGNSGEERSSSSPSVAAGCSAPSAKR